MRNKFLKEILLLLILTILSSCDSFIKLSEKNKADEFNISKPHFSVVFSHSIMGETHPCGCRHFPLGGLPQVAGLMHELQNEKDIFYVDIGDTFFPSTKIPPFIEDSLVFAAQNLALGLDQLGLKYLTPGDQDFAMGWSFLNDLSNKVKFQFLISNLANEALIKHKKNAIIHFGSKSIFLLGFVDPRVMQQEFQKDFLPISTALKANIEELKKNGYDEKNPNHQLIVLSHSGIESDEELAKLFPNITWIIGSHTQSFTNNPVEVGSTKIVQVLSKNHYIGEIMIADDKVQISEPFKYHEIRDDLKSKLDPNPFIAFIQNHKTKLEAIRDTEQKKFSTNTSQVVLKTASSCIECHSDKKDHWQETKHSIAFGTLLLKGEQNNTACMGCHSVGLGSAGGYINFKDIVSMKDESRTDAYWEEVKKAFSGVESVRSLKDHQVKKISLNLEKIDAKFEVSKNFSNVQCLNCHSQHPDHPFAVGEGEVSSEVKKQNLVNNCLACHTKEQSPEWYEKTSKGLSGDVQHQKILDMMSKVGCKASK